MVKLNRRTRRERFTAVASRGSNRAETNSRRRATPRCSARTNRAAKMGIPSNAQNHSGAPKFIRSTRSRQFLPNRLRQQKLRDQQPGAAHDAKWKQIAVLLIFL